MLRIAQYDKPDPDCHLAAGCTSRVLCAAGLMLKRSVRLKRSDRYQPDGQVDTSSFGHGLGQSRLVVAVSFAAQVTHGLDARDHEAAMCEHTLVQSSEVRASRRG